MAQAANNELVEDFEQFFRDYYRDDIGDLARGFPTDRRSLYLDWQDLYRFDPDLADDYLSHPEDFREKAEEALRLYDLPVDVKLGGAHVRLCNLPETTPIRDLRSRHVNTLIAVNGLVRKATDVRPKIQNAAFECQRCGTLTRVQQGGPEFHEPHECQGCERQGPFQLNVDQSEFVDAQSLRIQESPEGLKGGETPRSIDVKIEDDLTGEVTPGDQVTVTGVLRIDQSDSGENQSAVFDTYMEGIAVEIEDEEFEDMEITEEDKKEIVRLSENDDIYEQMVRSIAPSIYGYEEQKLAMGLQLFSGVTKHLPDGTRLRGDLHILFIGDPGTGKCVRGDTPVLLGDGTRVPIREVVESNLDDPKPVDDGVWDEVDISLPTMTPDGRMVEGEATKVWKREAPDSLVRIRTERDDELVTTPSHPLFASTEAGWSPVRADDLSEGTKIALHERVATDGGTAIQASRRLPMAETEGTVIAGRIESIESVDPDVDWVYDLEVADTHSYVSNGVVSHNSQMLQYIQKIAPRSVYSSGKGSSAAGLCVTGDTMVHTAEGFVPIREIATEYHPDPVSEETAAEATRELYTYDREAGSVEPAESSHVWRMPEKECRRVETAHGKELEASTDTPLLVCGEDGLEWREITEVEPGDHVAVPQYDGIERHSPPVREFLELTNEKIKPTAESVEFLRTRLREEFGTLRDAAAELGLSEDFVYDSLSNQHLPLEKLERILDAVGADLREIDLDRVMLRHGDGVRIPGEFDAELLYLAGLVFGDGDVMVSRRGGNRGHVRISNSDEELLERAAEIFERKFGKSPAIEYQDDRVPCIRVHSATVARFFSNLGVESPKDDIALDPRLTTAEHADAFLRGLFDADGSVSVRDDGGSSVQYSSTCDELARQVQLMLESYGIRARTRERDRRGTYELESGYEIESTSVQTHLAIYGTEVDRFADAVGFESETKSTALSEIVEDAPRRGERLPVGDALARTDGAGGSFYTNVERGDDPSRSRARELLADRDLGDLEGTVEEVVDADLVWDEVVAAEDTGKKEVFDLTVPETHNFLGNGIVTHNTAAAVRDDFGEGQQWSLEAGALVLADRGIAAIDELDKMECVTGDTLVHHPGGVERIADVARRVAENGEIEELSNGRRIRDVDLDVWTMADDGSIVRRPVTTVHEYDAPSSLTEVTLSTGESLTSTDDHPYFVFEDGERVERPASDLDAGDWVYVPREVPSAVSDGGTAVDPGEEGTEQSARGDPPTVDGDVKLRTVETVDSVDAAVDRETPKVYDLTVEDTHNFLANGLVVHNSDDRSAMHEALEQQSYHPDTEVLLADGRRVEIGEFVDERMAENEVVDGVDCEIIPVDDAAVHSVDVENGETTKLPIDRVSRHEAPEEFVRVTFSNGREVTVTPEHPMFVAEEGIDTVEAREIEAGAFVPAPRKLPNSSAAVDLEGEPTRGTEKDVSLPGELTPDLAEALGFLVAEGHSYAGSSHEIGFSNQDERLLARMEELMTGVFDVESSDNVNAAGTVTKRWTSTKLYRWFEANVPEVMETARDKRIPARVLGASEEVIRRFLVGAFAGDGGVESEAMSYSTASEGLAKDYADALSKVGVASRIHHDTAEDSWKVYVMGDSTERFVETVVDPADDRHERAREFVERSNETPRHHDVLPTEAAREIRELRTLLGLSLTGKFRPTLDEGYGVQVDTVEAEVATLRERIAAIEAELADADSLPEIRAAIDWSCGTLADRLGDETASSINYAENGGYDPDRRGSLADRARGTVEDALADASRRLDALVDRADLRYYRVREVETVANEGERATEWVYDVTVEPTNTFVSQGVVLHNSISISKAGINATLKSRCSLLGAANPKYGRFDQYEPIGEQIDLEPALISRFDLIFTVTDKPDEEEDRRLADHILTTNYAGELNTQREEMTSPDVSQEEVESFTDEVDPDIDPGLFRKYVAYAKQTCHPRMTEEAREEIKEFYTDLRSKGTDEDAPVPVTARQLEAIVRLAEASARVRLSDRVTLADSKRVIELVRSCLEDVGVDPESGEFDADVVETGTSKSQRERIKNIKGLIADVEEEYDDGAPVDVVLDRADEIGLDRDKAEHEIDKLKQKGEVYEPSTDHLRTT